jgi:hypothetical protein
MEMALAQRTNFDERPKTPPSFWQLRPANELVKMPVFLLQIFAFLPLHTKARFCSILCQLNQLLHMTGSAVAFAVVFLKLTAYSINSEPGRNGSALVKGMSAAWCFFEYARSIVILAIFYSKRNLHQCLFESAERLIKSSNVNLTGISKGKFLKKAIEALSLAVIVLHLIWEFIRWLNYILPMPDVSTNTTIIDLKNQSSVPKILKLSVPEVLYKCTFYLEALLFCLSQQVVILAVVSGILLRHFVAANNANIIQLKNHMVDKFWQKKHSYNSVSPLPGSVLLELQKIQEQHLEIVLYGQQINSLFGLLLFFAYGLNLLTVFGFVANAIANVSPLFGYQIYIYFSILIFGSYIILIVWPLAKAHKEVPKELNIHQF